VSLANRPTNLQSVLCLKEYLYILFIFAAFLSSLSVYRLDAAHYKVIAIVTTLDLVLEIWANALAAHHLSNIAVYNLGLLPEFILYGFYFGLILKYNWVRTFIPLYLFSLLLCWFVSTVLVIGIGRWNAYFSIAGSLFTVAFSIVYYYQMFTASELVPLRTSFEFWIATALILFFTCTLPYFGMLHYLTVIFRPLAKRGFSPLQLINIIFYSIVTYAFLCRINIRKSWRSSSRGA
jgi:hypothetical protein